MGSMGSMGDEELNSTLSALRTFVRKSLMAGLSGADAAACVVRAWPKLFEAGGPFVRVEEQEEGVDLLAVGKASIAMCDAAINEMERMGLRFGRGLVVHPTTSKSPWKEQAGVRPMVDSYPSEHPIPGSLGERAARETIRFVEKQRKNLLVLLSGGASAMLPAPLPGLSLEKKQELTERMLASGASIAELNLVRRSLSAVKGGRLAELCGADSVAVMVLSDVVGNDLGTVGSGPFYCQQDPTVDELAVVAQRRLGAFADEFLNLVQRISPMRRSVRAPKVEHLIVGDAGSVLRAMISFASASVSGASSGSFGATDRGKGLTDCAVVNLGSEIEGEAVVVARDIVAEALRRQLAAPNRPLLLVGAGETTVTVRGNGVGGRNQELALAVAWEWSRQISEKVQERVRRPLMVFGSLATDGVDGPTTAAGAVVDSTTLRTLRERGIDVERALGDNDSHTALAAVGSLIETGPTGTNVGDLFLLLVTAEER